MIELVVSAFVYVVVVTLLYLLLDYLIMKLQYRFNSPLIKEERLFLNIVFGVVIVLVSLVWYKIFWHKYLGL